MWPVIWLKFGHCSISSIFLPYLCYHYHYYYFVDITYEVGSTLHTYESSLSMLLIGVGVWEYEQYIDLDYELLYVSYSIYTILRGKGKKNFQEELNQDFWCINETLSKVNGYRILKHHPLFILLLYSIGLKKSWWTSLDWIMLKVKVMKIFLYTKQKKIVMKGFTSWSFYFKW